MSRLQYLQFFIYSFVAIIFDTAQVIKLPWALAFESSCYVNWFDCSDYNLVSVDLLICSVALTILFSLNHSFLFAGKFK